MSFAYKGIEVMLIIVPFNEKSRASVKSYFGRDFFSNCLLYDHRYYSHRCTVDRRSDTLTWPTIDLMRSFEIPGLIFEWFESLLLVIWIMQIFSNFTISYYAAVGLSQFLQKKVEPILFALLPVIYLIAMTPKNINQLF